MGTIGFAFFESYAANEGVLNTLESGELADKEIEWLIDSDGIYFEVQWIHGMTPKIYDFYTPAESLQHIWEILGLD